MIPAVIERCAGIDVGKKFVVACAISGAVNGDGQAEIRKFGTDNLNLERLAAWLEECGCTHVVMESTGDYWRPIYNVLEEATDAELVLANAQQVKGLRGHKTDPDDAHWLAHLLRHGMIRPSFIPPLEIRQLRDLTRRRKQLVRAGAQERNRIQKTLESANIKLGNVLTDIFGVSGQLMLDKLIEGKATAGEIADLAQKKARKKIPQIRASLEGHRMNAIIGRSSIRRWITWRFWRSRSMSSTLFLIRRLTLFRNLAGYTLRRARRLDSPAPGAPPMSHGPLPVSSYMQEGK